MGYIVKSGIRGKRTVAFTCPRCNFALESPFEEAGGQYPCPTCGHELTVPGVEELKKLRAEESANAEEKASEEKRAAREARHASDEMARARAEREAAGMRAKESQRIDGADGKHNHYVPWTSFAVTLPLVALAVVGGVYFTTITPLHRKLSDLTNAVNNNAERLNSLTNSVDHNTELANRTADGLASLTTTVNRNAEIAKPSTPVATKPADSIDPVALENFAKKLMPILQRGLLKEENKLDQMRGFTGDAKYDRKISVLFQSTDVKKNDSIVHPVVGEIEWIQEDVLTIVSFIATHSYRCKMQVIFVDSKWKLLRTTRRCEQDRMVPEFGGHKSRVGVEENLPTNWADAAIAEAQR